MNDECPRTGFQGRSSFIVRRSSFVVDSVAVDIIAVSPAMRRAVELAGRVASAPLTSTVLVQGESGTGKDLVARLVHDGSGAKGALVTIDCAALPEGLLESEIFGHEKGAFTGASEMRPGRFEAARDGTLVLDEIAALTPSAQAKLLRVLDERRFRRLGGAKEIDLRARVVALTNVDLRRAVAAGDFRQDLYFRLNVVFIELPSLREQPEAIEPLAERFARRFAHTGGAGCVPRVTPAALQALQAYHFPGNVRELRNLIERAVVAGAGPGIWPSDLPDYVVAPRPVVGRRPTLAEVEAEYVGEVLAESRGNKALAARILGISRKNLYERLKRMNSTGHIRDASARGEPER
jgi:DNA-binding NtrC family response regulator